MNFRKKAQRVFDIEIAALRKTRANLPADFEKAVHLLARALKNRGKIIVTGVGKSGNLAHKIAATLTSTGATSVVLNSVDALHGDLGIVGDGDAVLALSYTGETDELINLLPALKRLGVGIIAITGNPRSTLAKFSDAVLAVHVPREACPFNMAPTASTTAMLAMGDALAMVLLESRGFTQKQYAKLHPGGAIGRSLLLKISDIMRTGRRNAVISAEKSVQDALLVMTAARSGTIAVTDKRGKLAGVFTDGDFRRKMSTNSNVLTASIGSVMTPNPITIRHDALAVEALKIFEQRQIDDLIVVDKKNRPVGIVDSQDLPKFKIM
jgi:arabinose-5-phosphate isomerase